MKLGPSGEKLAAEMRKIAIQTRSKDVPSEAWNLIESTIRKPATGNFSVQP
jgi:hypothetical protein